MRRFADEAVKIVDPAIQALGAQYANLDLTEKNEPR